MPIARALDNSFNINYRDDDSESYFVIFANMHGRLKRLSLVSIAQQHWILSISML